MPTYADLQLVKSEFIGNDKKAIMVFPEEENYVNIHPNCLHLWYSAENPIPEFSEGKGTIQNINKKDKKMERIKMFRDSFQNWKNKEIPKAQLILTDIPYQLGTKAYGSNPMWYEGGG